MRSIDSEFLFRMEADLEPPVDVGEGAMGHRMIADVSGGRFEGPRLRGKLHRSGADWFLIDMSKGLVNLDVRATLETDDGAVIFTHYLGRIAFDPTDAVTLFDPTNRANLDHSTYYFRTAPLFETGSEKYEWLNRSLAVGIGELTATGVAYDVHMIK